MIEAGMLFVLELFDLKFIQIRFHGLYSQLYKNPHTFAPPNPQTSSAKKTSFFLALFMLWFLKPSSVMDV